MQLLGRQVDQCVEGAAAAEGVGQSTRSRSRSPRLGRIASPGLAQRQVVQRHPGEVVEGWAVEPVGYRHGCPRRQPLRSTSPGRYRISRTVEQQVAVGTSLPAPSGCCSSEDGGICNSTPCTNCVLCHMAFCLEHARVCEDCPKPRWRLLCWSGVCMAGHRRRAHTSDLGRGRSASLWQRPCLQPFLRRSS